MAQREADGAPRGSAPGPAIGTPLGLGPFVGRDRELTSLRAKLEAALAGRPGRVWVLGDAGIGKTRTVEELSCYCRLRGAMVHAVRPEQLVAEPARMALHARAAAPGLLVLDAVERCGLARVGNLARDLEGSAVLVAITARTRKLEAELAGEAQIAIPQLGVDEIARLMSMLWGRDVAPDLAQRASHETEGNPARLRNWISRNAKPASGSQSTC